MGDVERMKRAERADLERGDAMSAVIDRAGGTGEVENVVDAADVEGLADVLFYKFESGFIAQVGEIGAASRKQVIDDHDLPAFAEKSIAEMGSQKSGATGDYSAS